MRRDRPPMPERIDQAARSIAVELVFHCVQHLCASLECAEPKTRSTSSRKSMMPVPYSPAPRLRAAISAFRILVSQHHSSVSNLDLCVSHLAAGRPEAQHLSRAKRPFVEVDRFRCPLDDQIRGDRRSLREYVLLSSQPPCCKIHLTAGVSRIVVKIRLRTRAKPPVHRYATQPNTDYRSIGFAGADSIWETPPVRNAFPA